MSLTPGTLMLGLVEETILLLSRDDGSSFVRRPTSSMRLAIAGAVLTELVDANRIETDLLHLFVVDDTPTGDGLLDPTLAEISTGEQQKTLDWIEVVAERADVIRAGALGRLIGKGILTERDRRFLRMSRTRCYPAAHGDPCQAARRRLVEVLRRDPTPSRRDGLLICLADVCGILPTLMSRAELKKFTPRLKRVARRNVIGLTMARAIVDVRASVVATTIPG